MGAMWHGKTKQYGTSGELQAVWFGRRMVQVIERQELRLGDKIVKGLSKEYEFILK